MFSFFKKKKQATVLDAFISSAYGTNPPKRTANSHEASIIAFEELLGGRINLLAVTVATIELSKGSIPYSTHDLAVAVTLGFFKKRELMEQLGDIQLKARETVRSWAIEGKVVGLLAQSFEKTLANLYQESYSPITYAQSQKLMDSEQKDESELPDAIKHLRKQLGGKSPQEAARSVIDCITWQHNTAMMQRGFDEEDDEDDEQDDEQDDDEAGTFLSQITDIEKAFLSGSARAAIIAFDVAEEKEDIFWFNVVGGYAGISDQDKIESEFMEISFAVDSHEDAFDAGALVMYSYLLFGKQEIESTKLASLLES